MVVAVRAVGVVAGGRSTVVLELGLHSSVV